MAGVFGLSHGWVDGIVTTGPGNQAQAGLSLCSVSVPVFSSSPTFLEQISPRPRVIPLSLSPASLRSGLPQCDVLSCVWIFFLFLQCFFCSAVGFFQVARTDSRPGAKQAGAGCVYLWQAFVSLARERLDLGS